MAKCRRDRLETNIRISNSITGKDMNKVSFVGLHATQYGIIAFADSKSTISRGGCYFEDKKRGKIQKIFSNSQFICVTHGNNELFENRTKIEDYINENLNERNYYAFFDKMLSDLKKSKPYYNNGIYQFIIGFYKDKKPYLRNVMVDYHASWVDYQDIKGEYAVSYAGSELYLKMYDIIPKYNDIPIEEYASLIKKQVEAMIDIFDDGIQYNPVGKPVNIEVYKPSYSINEK